MSGEHVAPLLLRLLNGRAAVLRGAEQILNWAMSGEESDAPGGGGLPSQKAIEDLEERLVQRILRRVSRQDAGEGSSGGAKEGGEYGRGLYDTEGALV